MPVVTFGDNGYQFIPCDVSFLPVLDQTRRPFGVSGAYNNESIQEHTKTGKLFYNSINFRKYF